MEAAGAAHYINVVQRLTAPMHVYDCCCEMVPARPEHTSKQPHMAHGLPNAVLITYDLFFLQMCWVIMPTTSPVSWAMTRCCP